MPHSHPHGKAWASKPYCDLQPSTVIDIGPGAGMWSDALRPHWRSIWTGVEIWEPYIEKYGLRSKYDDIVVLDARAFVVPDGTGLVIAGDVLEHIPQSDAEYLIAAWSRVVDALLISVPVVHYEQGALEGNPHETHLWHPTHEWAMDVLSPDEYTVGEVVGAYWKAYKPG